MAERLVAGRYRVLDRLGAGGMATVLLAEDELLGRRVALKQLHAVGSDELVARLGREARIGASLSHPNVVHVYDVLTEEGGLSYIVMEHVDGGSLRDALGDGPMAPERAVAVLRDIAAALDHAHERGVVHRDVKPANVLLRRDGRAKLADLGIAMAADQTRITTSGAALGSVAYMAPEQLDGRPITRAADVHALAAVAFETLTGRRARAGGTAAELAARAARGGPPDLQDAWPAGPPAALAAIARGMAADPAARHPTAGAFVEELAAGLGVAPAAASSAPAPDEPVARRTPRPPRAEATEPDAATGEAPPAPRVRVRDGAVAAGGAGPRRRALPALVAALLLALAGTTAVLLTGGDEDAQDATRAARDAGARDATTDGDGASSPRPGTSTGASGSGSSGRGTGAAPAAPATAGGGRGGGRGGPAAAVRTLYAAAARQDDAAVCAGLGPALRARFSCPQFTGQFATLRSVAFDRLETVERQGEAATVALSTRARHTDRTDRCRGTARLVRQGGRWLLDAIDVACARA